MNRIFSLSPLSQDLVSLLLRLTLGGQFVYFGYGKLANYQVMLPMFHDVIGIGGELTFHLVIFAEFFCGIFVTFGILTRLSVIPIFITMTVAFFIAHAAENFDSKALPFTLWCLCVIVFVAGSGKYSLDYFLFRGKN